MELQEIVYQEWVESEIGWGVRSDGCTLHKTLADRDWFVRDYWSKQPREVPNEYSRPCGDPCMALVSKDVYEQIEGKAAWLLQSEMMEYMKSGKLNPLRRLAR